MAQVGMKKYWKEHVSASMRSINVHRNNKWYASYQSTNCDLENLPSDDDKKQLEQLIMIRIRITKVNLTSIIESFSWSDIEVR